MNITRENINDLNAVIKLKVEKADYEGKVENTLKDYRKKANIKGFRPGMVPMGLIKKMYGKAVQVEEINKLVSESIYKYITDEKIEILGDPLPIADENERIDFDTMEEFTFSFEVGLSPAVEMNLSKKNQVTAYDIAIDEKMMNDYINNYARRYGDFSNAELSEDKDILKGKLEGIYENNEIPAEAVIADNTSLAINIIKDEEIKNSFIGKKADETIDFDIRKAFPNDNEIAGLLRIEKEKLSNIPVNFRFTINEVSRFVPAEIGPELFNKVYGEGVINSEEEFRKKIEGEISESLKRESDFKLLQDIKELTIGKCDFSLPEDFLKRWLLKVNEKTTSEQIEQEFDSFRKDLKWQLVRNKIARDNEIKITEEELQAEAEKITRFQFQQYGLFYATDEQIANYAKETLKREEDAKRIADKVIDDKVLMHLKDVVKVESKNVSVEEFNKLFEQQPVQ